MTKIEIGVNEKGKFAIIKVFTDDSHSGYFTRSGLEDYKPIEILTVYDESSILSGPVSKEYLKKLVSKQENSLRKIKDILK